MFAARNLLATPPITAFAPVTITGTPQAAGASSITLPTHAVGNIIVLAAFANASNTTPTKPSASGTVPAWADIDNNTGASNCSMRTAYFVATATNHTSGTWSGANDMAAIVLRGQAATPIGGHGESGSTGATSIAPAVTMAQIDGTSVLLHFHGFVVVNAGVWDAAPAGYTRRAAEVTGASGICLNTKDVTTSDGSTSQGSAGFGSQPYRGATVEIRAH